MKARKPEPLWFRIAQLGSFVGAISMMGGIAIAFAGELIDAAGATPVLHSLVVQRQCRSRSLRRCCASEQVYRSAAVVTRAEAHPITMNTKPRSAQPRPRAGSPPLAASICRDTFS